MKLLGITKIKLSKDGNGENVPHLEINEVVLAHCNIVNNDYQEFCIHLFQINDLVNYYVFHLKYLFFKKIFNSEFSCIEVWFTDQNSKPLEIEDKKASL